MSLAPTDQGAQDVPLTLWDAMHVDLMTRLADFSSDDLSTWWSDASRWGAPIPKDVIA